MPDNKYIIITFDLHDEPSESYSDIDKRLEQEHFKRLSRNKQVNLPNNVFCGVIETTNVKKSIVKIYMIIKKELGFKIKRFLGGELKNWVVKKIKKYK